MAAFLAPLIGAGIGALTGYMTAPDDNKVGGTITGGLLGGVTGGIGNMAKGLMAGKAAASTGRIASSWNPVSLLKSAYTLDAGGLFNLGMDALPLISDIANNDVGLKSFSGFGGTMAGTRFGGRELNKLGDSTYRKLERNAVDSYNYQSSANKMQMGLPSSRSPVNGRTPQYGSTGNTFTKLNPDRDAWIDSNMSTARDKMLNDPKYSRQGYNMAVGMGADMGLYSLTAGMNKPKESPDMIRAREQQEFSDSPVSKYMQMTGML
jgi:hypothetical protein